MGLDEVEDNGRTAMTQHRRGEATKRTPDQGEEEARESWSALHG